MSESVQPHDAPAVLVEAERSLPRLFTLRRSTLVEAALFFAAALTIDLLFLDGSRYWAIEPHPFWLIVVLVAVQYGTNDALAVVALAIIALFSGAVPEQAIDQDLYEYLFELTRRPLMWFAAAVVLGELKMRDVRRRADLAEALRTSIEQEAQVQRTFKRMEAAKDKLEVHIAAELRSAASAFKAARSVARAKSGEVMLGILELIKGAISAEKFSLFLLNNNCLEAGIQSGWEEGDPFASAYLDTSPLLRAVVAERRTLCVTNAEDAAILDGDGILAGPVVNEDTQEVVGMVKIEALGILDLNLSTVEKFRAICEWIGAPLAMSLQLEKAQADQASAAAAKEQAVAEPGSFGNPARLTSYLTELAQHFRFGLTMIELRVEDDVGADAETRGTTAEAVHAAVNKVLSFVPLAFDFQNSEERFSVVLPHADPAEARSLANMLAAAVVQELKRGGRAAKVSAEPKGLTDDGDAPARDAAVVRFAMKT